MPFKSKIVIYFDTLFTGKKAWLYILILCAAVLLALYPSLTNDFQQEWDDQWMLLENPILFYSTWEAIGRSFITFYHNQYSPMNQLYYMGIFTLAGFDPSAFHLGSVVIHMFNAVLVYLLVEGVMKLIKPGARLKIAQGVPLFVALIFAIHPLQVESIAWISASKVILYTTFTLLGLLSYVNYKNDKRYFFLGLTFLSYIASLMVKESCISFRYPGGISPRTDICT